ncbi:MAG: macro domain-containing protein [Clostridia bacterium]|nr:macro domain-containing protein [Clostridia bacterium]
MPLQIIRQDITKMQVDAIVNTTNEDMIGYSGVDLAVHRGAGPAMESACARISPLGLGMAKITPGFDLPARYVIHTSGPVWQGGLRGEKILLRSCYEQSLKLAVDNGLTSVAFPLISSGTYGYPKDQVLTYAVEIISEFLYHHELMVYLCVYDRTSYAFSRQLFDEISDYITGDVMPAPKVMPSMMSARCADMADDDCLFAPQSGKPVPMADTPSKVPGVTATCCDFRYPDDDEDTLTEYLKSMDQPFAVKLFRWIDDRGMTDVECYKKANVDKKTFSKIKCNPQGYKPSKQTALGFAIALKLDIDETQDLLASAGLTLSDSSTFDKIIRFFIERKNYNIFKINEALFEFDQVPLGF